MRTNKTLNSHHYSLQEKDKCSLTSQSITPSSSLLKPWYLKSPAVAMIGTTQHPHLPLHHRCISTDWDSKKPRSHKWTDGSSHEPRLASHQLTQTSTLLRQRQKRSSATTPKASLGNTFPPMFLSPLCCLLIWTEKDLHGYLVTVWSHLSTTLTPGFP